MLGVDGTEWNPAEIRKIRATREIRRETRSKTRRGAKSSKPRDNKHQSINRIVSCLPISLRGVSPFWLLVSIASSGLSSCFLGVRWCVRLLAACLPSYQSCFLPLLSSSVFALGLLVFPFRFPIMNMSSHVEPAAGGVPAFNGLSSFYNFLPVIVSSVLDGGFDCLSLFLAPSCLVSPFLRVLPVFLSCFP